MTTDPAATARRMKWGFRLAFYPVAALAAVLLLTGREDSEASSWRIGKTDQGNVFELRLRDGRPSFINTGVDATCTSGRETVVPWSRGETAPTPFEFEDGRLRVSEQTEQSYGDGWTGTRTWTLEARLDGDAANGWMAYAEELHAANGARYDCSSGDVAFTLREPD